MKTKFTADQKLNIKRIMREQKVSRNTAVKRMLALPVAPAPIFATVKTPTAAKAPQSMDITIANRKEGLRLYQVAGRPSKQECILLWGVKGPVMTWKQRAEAGIPAERVQEVLLAKGIRKSTVAPAPAKAAVVGKK